MSDYQVTYPENLETTSEQASSQSTNQTPFETVSRRSKIEEMMKFKNQSDRLDDLRANKNFISLIINIISSLILIFIGSLYTSLNFIPAILLTIIFIPVFVISALYVAILKTSRNIIWFQMLGTIVSILLYAIFSSSLFSATLWISIFLIAFLVFVSFMETENYIKLNRIFIFNMVTAQGRKLLILSALLLISLGSFLSINKLGGREFIQTTIKTPSVYNQMFDPAKRGSVFSQLFLTNKEYLNLVAIDTNNSKTYYDLLLIKIQASTKDAQIFFDKFIAENPSCKPLVKQESVECSTAFTEFAKKDLVIYSKTEYAINPVDEKSEIKLDTKLTPANVKFLIINFLGNYYSSSFEKDYKTTNPNIVFTILGKRDAISLFLSLILFCILLLTIIPLNILSSLIAKLIFNRLKKTKVISLNIVKDEIEVLSF
jgi:hypothetical protein